jgi:ferric-dicitrate binding protein FerR (iron transport regulator)
MNAQSHGKLSKFQRYRARKKAAGLKEVRLWVRDPQSPQFKAEMEAFAEWQRNSKSEREAIEFIEAAMADVLKDIPPY